MSNDKQYLSNIVYLRGIMILFVVLGHALTIFVGNYAGHTMINSSIGSCLRAIIYSFHMPVFMAISGFLYYFEVQKVKSTLDSVRGLRKNSLSSLSPLNKFFNEYSNFVLKKTKRLLVPFVIVLYLWRKPLFLFSTSAFSISSIFSVSSIFSGMNILQTAKTYLSFSTTGALWFLYVLFIIFLFQRLFLNVIWKSDTTILTWFCVFGLVSIAAYLFSGPIHHVMLHNAYFYTGAVIHRFSKDKLSDNTDNSYFLTLHSIYSHSIYYTSAVIAIIGTVIIVFVQPTGLLGSLIAFITAVADILCAFCISKKCEHIFAKPVSFISDLSMGIYLFHEPLIIALGSRIPKNIGGGTSDLFYTNRSFPINYAYITTKEAKIGFYSW